MMEDYEDSAKSGAMVALLPITDEWCKIKCPHLTVVYAGDVKDLRPSDFNEMAKEAADIALFCPPLTLTVTGQQVFGDGSQDNPAVDVFTLRPSQELLAIRRRLEGWNKSDFPFAPHVTIGPHVDGSYMPPEYQPRLIAFNRLIVSFGDQDLVFWLRNTSNVY